MSRVAFVDESYVAGTSHYLLAAVVMPNETSAAVSDTTRTVPRRSRTRFHWHSEHEHDRHAMVAHVANVSDLVVVSRPVRESRSERARGLCLRSLMAHLQGLEPPISDVVLESRTAVLDRRDANRIEGLRASGRLSPRMRFSFDTKAEPLLWLPDAVAGAVNAELAGDARYSDLLAERLTRIRLGGSP